MLHTCLHQVTSVMVRSEADFIQKSAFYADPANEGLRSSIVRAALIAVKEHTWARRAETVPVACVTHIERQCLCILAHVLTSLVRPWLQVIAAMHVALACAATSPRPDATSAESASPYSLPPVNSSKGVLFNSTFQCIMSHLTRRIHLDLQH